MLLHRVLILSSFIICALSWDGTATNWCDSISFIKNTCGYPADGYYGALSDAQFPEIIKCSCRGNRSYRRHPTLGDLPKCDKFPDCETGFCGRQMCVECTDSRCYNPGQRVTIRLSDACPADHPQNVDQCVDNAPDLNYCKCTQRNSPHIDLGCEVFKAIAPEHTSPLRVRVTDGPCGNSPSTPPPSRPQSGGCSDNPPNNDYTCEQQASWGKCSEGWMSGFCDRSCGRCSGGGNGGNQNGGQSGGQSGDCSDNPPNNDYTCQQQASWGKCSEGWMSGFCDRSCGRCGGNGGNNAGPSGGCSDNPPNNDYTCQQQASWGKCREGWMAGFCDRSCGRCGNRAVAENMATFNTNINTDTNTNTSTNTGPVLSVGSIVIIVVGVVIGVGMIVLNLLFVNPKMVETA